MDTATATAYIPFVIVSPDVHSLSADVIRLEERERRLGRGHLHRYVLVLFVVERALAGGQRRGAGARRRVGNSEEEKMKKESSGRK